jgi:hypothetical protein
MKSMREYSNDVVFENQPLETQFKTLLTSYCDQASAFGIKLIPYQDETFKRFLSYSPERQRAIHQTFSKFYEILARAVKHEIDLNDNHALVWWALKEMGLRPSSDLFQSLEKDDVIEVYDPNFIQVFRTFNFFYLCCYSLDQVLTYEWYELYRRDEKITQDMVQICSNVITGKIDRTFFSDYPEHTVEQHLSPDKRKIRIRHRFVSPLHGPNGIYMFNVFKVSKVEPATQPELNPVHLAN